MIEIQNKKLLTLSCAGLLLAACGDDDNSNGNNTNNTNGSQETVSCVEEGGGQICTIEGTITEDLRLENDPNTTWILSGPVFVGERDGNGATATLTIDPGVTVFADATARTGLFIQRGSKIIAQGTADAPIAFTPTTAEGERQSGAWGGLVLNGRAPINSGSEAEGEGNSGKYGGDDPTDNSGVLKYVRVEWAGDKITETNELNGIAFQGVGSGTEVDYIQVHMNSDDGVEFFGGTVNAKHVVLTGNGDDSLDWTEGWQGSAQYVLIQMFDNRGERGIEADNNEDNNDATPRSAPTLANMTIIGAAGSDTGILLRRGTGAKIYNTIVTHFDGACLDVDGESTFNNGWDASSSAFNGNLLINNSLVYGCDTAFKVDDDETELPFTVENWFQEGVQNAQADPLLAAPTRITSPNYTPQAGSPAITAGMKPESAFFEDTTFIGAVGPDNDWTSGWTIHVEN